MVLHRSLCQTSALPQELQGLQKRQAQYCEIIAFNALEELHAKAFQLISADARSRGSSSAFQIKIEKFVRKCTHGQPRHADTFEQYRPILDKGDGRVQF